MLDSLAQRWHCPPWEVEAAPARYLRMAKIVEMGTPEREGGDQQWQ